MIICHCTAATKEEITEALEIWESLEKIQEMTGAGTGCGSCLEYVTELFDVHRRECNWKKSDSPDNRKSCSRTVENP